MNENPYEATSTADDGPRWRARWRLVVAGLILVLLAVVVQFATIYHLVVGFGTAADPANNTPSPQQLASTISVAQLITTAAVLMGLGGAVLMIVGFVLRRPVHEPP